MKNNICPICRKESEFVYLESHVDNDQEYKLYECKEGCHTQFWEPLKNPGAEWYEKDERYANRNTERDLEFGRHYIKILDFLKPFKGKVLDAGCGTGSFLYWAQTAGWEIAGFDFDRDAINIAKNIFHLKNVEVNDLTGYYKAHSAQKFDLLTFFEVFEHLDNHNEFIKMVKNLLKDRGYIAMSVPCRDIVRWLNPLDLPPRHLTRWDENSLKRFLERHGFNVLSINKKSVGLEHILMRLRFRFGRYFSFNLVGKQKKRERNNDAGSANTYVSKKIKILHHIARMKDWMLFGLPTFIIWLALILFPKKYITLYAIAQKSD